jgi:hypothetical protein
MHGWAVGGGGEGMILCLVVELVVAPEHDEAAPGHGQRVEHLLSGFPPHVRILANKESWIISEKNACQAAFEKNTCSAAFRHTFGSWHRVSLIIIELRTHVKRLSNSRSDPDTGILLREGYIRTRTASRTPLIGFPIPMDLCTRRFKGFVSRDEYFLFKSFNNTVNFPFALNWASLLNWKA